MLRFAVVLGVLVTLSLNISVAENQNPKDKAIEKAKAKQEANAVAQLLDRFDKNKDGKLAKDELPDRLQSRFAELDKNQDRSLDKEELRVVTRLFAAAGPDVKAKLADKFKDKFGKRTNAGFPDFDALDKDADGRLTAKEVKGTRIENIFADIDTNKDNKIDPKEYKAYSQKK